MAARTALSALIVLSLACSAGRAAEVETSIRTDPVIADAEEYTVFSPKLRDLWIAALTRPEVSSRLRAAQAIANAHARGMTDLGEAIPTLTKQFTAATDSDVRLALARALVRLDAKSAAPQLAAAMNESLDMALVVEPALARWDYAAARKVWLDRLSAEEPPVRQLLLAISGLVTVGESQAAGRLAELASDAGSPVDVRLEAARGLGALKPADLETQAKRLMADETRSGLINRLVAALYLAQHSGEEAQSLLLRLAVDAEPAVAAIALSRLLEIDPHLVTPLNEKIVASRDAKVRGLAVKTLHGQATPASVKLLGPMLADLHPGVRRAAQESLISLADVDELDPIVRQEAMKVLQGERVYGIQEAALVVGALDHEPAADRLVELMEHKDATVMENTAWALKKIAVPSTGDAIFAKIQHEAKRTTGLREALGRQMKADPNAVLDVPRLNPTYEQVEQLIQALARIGYKQALPHFKEYYPKPPLPAITDPPVLDSVAQPDLRASAIWATGILQDGELDPQFAAVCQGRLRDRDPANPEATSVQAMSAVALGRMKDESALPTLRRGANALDGYGWVAGACRWAVEKISGEKIADPPPRELAELGWFLEPLDFD